MRTMQDALRSMGRYVSEVLSPQPVLAEFTWTDTSLSPNVVHHWTTLGMVQGALEVSQDAFGWLRQRDRYAPTLVADNEHPYYTSALVADPRPDATLAGYTLDTGLTVVGYDLPVMERFEVRFAGERGDYTPPFARVQAVTAGGTSGPALYYERTQPMSIECYPKMGEDAEVNVFAATAVLDALERGFRREGVTEGRPLRVPLYDYDGVSLDEAGTRRQPSDYMTVLDFSPRLLPDPLDARRVAAIADVRVSWLIDVDRQMLPGRDGLPGTRTVASVKLDEQLS